MKILLFFMILKISVFSVVETIVSYNENSVLELNKRLNGMDDNYEHDMFVCLNWNVFKDVLDLKRVNFEDQKIITNSNKSNSTMITSDVEEKILELSLCNINGFRLEIGSIVDYNTYGNQVKLQIYLRSVDLSFFDLYEKRINASSSNEILLAYFKPSNETQINRIDLLTNYSSTFGIVMDYMIIESNESDFVQEYFNQGISRLQSHKFVDSLSCA